MCWSSLHPLALSSLRVGTLSCSSIFQAPSQHMAQLPGWPGFLEAGAEEPPGLPAALFQDSLRLGETPKSNPGRNPFSPNTPGHTRPLTWNTVTMAHSRESKFFRSGTVSPVSVRRLNLQPKMCIPRMLGGRDGGGSRDSHASWPPAHPFCSHNSPVRWEWPVLVPFYRRGP